MIDDNSIIEPDESMEFDAYVAGIVEAYEAKLREKDAEIERLKNIITATEVERETLRAANATFEAGMHWRNGLIIELCDALKVHSVREPGIEDLIQRAREATR